MQSKCYLLSVTVLNSIVQISQKHCLLVVVRASSENPSICEDVSLHRASCGGAGVDSDPETLHFELIVEAVLGEGFFWFKHAVDVQLVRIRLGSTRDGVPFHDERDVKVTVRK
jgi:hypothetical protein